MLILILLAMIAWLFTTLVAARKKVRALERQLIDLGGTIVRTTRPPPTEETTEFDEISTDVDAVAAPAVKQARIPKKAHALGGRRWSEGETGLAATFSYVDADGVVTDRDVRNWRSHGPHIKAHCLLAGASRTFRKDRIDDWATQGTVKH